MILFNLPTSLIVLSLFIGFILCVIYLGLLWLTVKYLPRVKHKVLLFFTSLVVRLGLFLCSAIFFAQQDPARFLWIVIGFIITRFCLVALVKPRRNK